MIMMNDAISAVLSTSCPCDNCVFDDDCPEVCGDWLDYYNSLVEKYHQVKKFV